MNYPILCYKTRQPDERSITIVHLAQKIPQRVINLGEWRFVCFVHLNFDVSTTTRQILFLVENIEKQVKLFMIELDPWKRMDRNVQFDQPESIFQFYGFVAKPVDSQDEPRYFSADKIRSAQIISKQVES